MNRSDRYPARVFWSDEDGGFIAVATDLPGCTAFGDTREAALAELESAIEAWIEAAKKAGNSVPVPSKTSSMEQYSGKVLLRMPRELHAKLAGSAHEQGVSLNHYMVYLLATCQEVHRHAFLSGYGAEPYKASRRHAT